MSGAGHEVGSPAEPEPASSSSAPPSGATGGVPIWKQPATISVAALATVALVGVIVVIVSVLQADSSGAGSSLAETEEESTVTVLAAAVQSCDVVGTASIAVADEGRTVTVDGKGDEESGGASITDTFCVLEALDVSAAALAQMEGTTSLQGRQSASWGDVDASWTYHPDNGLDMILTER